jgi:hypothetical protein
MKYRDIELYYQQALDDVGTKIIDLRTDSPLSAIRLYFYGSNGALGNKRNPLNDVITKIELVDGSDQLLSLTLKEAQALEFRRTGKMPYMLPDEVESWVQEESVTLLFGRHLWDPEYYMDLTKFRNPQLKITTNIAATRALAATAYVTNTLKVSVDLMVMEEGAAAAKGFMMAKNIYGFTSGTSGDEHIDMPVDYPYVTLMMRAYLEGNDVSENISRLKLNCDAGKFIPLDKKVADLSKFEQEDFGAAELHYRIFGIDGTMVLHALNFNPRVMVAPVFAGRIGGVEYSWSGRFKLHLTDHAGTAIAGDEIVHVIILGNCPHATIAVPFGKRENPETYFDPKIYGDIDLVLTQAAASAVAVILEQLRPYGAAA